MSPPAHGHETKFHTLIPLKSCIAMASPKFRLAETDPPADLSDQFANTDAPVSVRFERAAVGAVRLAEILIKLKKIC